MKREKIHKKNMVACMKTRLVSIILLLVIVLSALNSCKTKDAPIIPDSSINPDELVSPINIITPQSNYTLPSGYSGLFNEYIDLNDYIILQNDYAVIFILNDYTYSENFLETVMQCFKWVERVTKTNALSRQKNINYGTVHTKEDLIKMDFELKHINLFNEIANFDNRIYIYPALESSSSAFDNCLQIYDSFFLIDSYDSYEFFVLTHELAHVAQIRYAKSPCYCYPLVEGYAVWVTNMVAKDNNLKVLIEETDYHFFTNTIPSDLEKYFASDWVDDTDLDNNYRYGYLFCKYLEVTYGSGIFNEIFEIEESPVSFEADISVEDSMKERSRLYVESIKSITSIDVFSDCSLWFYSNKENIYGVNPLS